MVSKFARTIVITAFGVIYQAQASDKACACENGTPEENKCKTENENKCKSCDDYYFLAGGHCEACNHDPANRMGKGIEEVIGTDKAAKYGLLGCSKCKKEGKCTEVISGEGVFLKDDIATACHDGCNECTAADKCTEGKEKDGYYADANKKPVKCHEGCKQCTEADKCKDGQVKDGYYADADDDNKPKKCATGCNKCTEAEKCSDGEAADGFMLDGEKKPKACEKNCKKCSTTECTEAELGFVKTASEKAVKACSANCDNCDTAGEGNCDTAKDGYFVKDNQAVKCADGCASCDAETTCIDVASGYTLNDAKEPKKCAKGCASCTRDENKDPAKCAEKELDIGYFLKDDKPKACGAGCAKCTDETTCLIPKATHHRNDEGSIADCPKGCEFCLGKTCLKKGKEKSGGDVSGSVNNILSMAVAVAIGVATTQL